MAEDIEKLKKEIEVLKSKLKEKQDNQKKGMIERASKGSIVSRPPFGYLIDNGNLVPAQNYSEIEEIFQEFLTSDVSLRQLSEKHHLSVNGLKKILTNFTYIGKIKFNNQIHQGNHKPIISTTLFNHVQNKLENLGIK
ncbi:MAG: recombinase family protein [Candidatus Pacearchaeota archaeon]